MRPVQYNRRGFIQKRHPWAVPSLPIVRHAAANCYAPPRCVKCLDPHWTKNYARTRESGGKSACCNCGSDHTANDGGCPVGPKPKPRNNLYKNIRKATHWTKFTFLR
ncbi:hypothetical protein EVAR_87608_1 [Eumeta japonica]|uniref:Nucleic-acid-binding protein from transposon X-element n=1 Tax=Eumeta variegata TaxID=151549 RepID=A0A4C1WNX7_EUMVA|nr:hypothetical protein EVAR_87608_1 [Eumeta japonica]